MLVIKLPILFSLPFDLQWKDLFSCRQKTVNEKFAEIKSFCPVVSLTWNKRKPSLHFSQNLQPGSPLQTLLFTLALAVNDSGKKQKETQIRIQNLGSKPPLKSKKGKHFCHVFKIWYCGKKPEVLKLCLGVSAFGRNSWPAQLHSSWLVDLWNNGIEKWFKRTAKHCSSQTQPHFEELLLLN